MKENPYAKKADDAAAMPSVDQPATCTTIETPGSNETNVTDRGPMPPEGKKPSEKVMPWKPKGRK